MNSITPTLVQKPQELPPQRLSEVEDFVEFLVGREMRSAAGARLGELIAELDALKLPPLSDDEISAEIQAARQERAAQLHLIARIVPHEKPWPPIIIPIIDADDRLEQQRTFRGRRTHTIRQQQFHPDRRRFCRT